MTIATLHFNQHEVCLEKDEALALFKHAVAMRRRGGMLSITPDTVIVINDGTHMSITIEDRFRDAFDQALTQAPAVEVKL